MVNIVLILSVDQHMHEAIPIWKNLGLLQPCMVVTRLLQGWIMAVASLARCPQPCEVVTTLYVGCELVVK